MILEVLWILQDYVISLVYLPMPSLGFSTHDLGGFVSCGSCKIMQDLLCIFPLPILDFLPDLVVFVFCGS